MRGGGGGGLNAQESFDGGISIKLVIRLLPDSTITQNRCVYTFDVCGLQSAC